MGAPDGGANDVQHHPQCSHGGTDKAKNLDPDPLQSEKTRHLVTQLGLMDNRLLNNNLKVRDHMACLIHTYKAAFTDGDALSQ